MYQHSYAVDTYTYIVMGLSVAGGYFSKGLMTRKVFVVPFIAAPLMAFYQKK